MVREDLANHQAVAHATSTLVKIRRARRGAALTGRHAVFGAAYRVLDADRPSPTVTRSGFRDFIHPTEDRLCTVRELARLQGFPDSYEFKGRRCDTYAKGRYVKQTQHEQLGNAVPPPLAKVLGRSIRRQLLDGDTSGVERSAIKNFDRLYRRLDSLYDAGERLGNKRNALDELIFIMLSRRAQERQYARTYRHLARRYRPWAKLVVSDLDELREILKPLGLANQRAHALRDAVTAITEDFGKTTLAPIKNWSYSRTYHYLRSLPGVNDKTAKCVMLYALDHPALPVDTHTYRVARRTGIIPRDLPYHRAATHLERVVPRERRGRFHVLTVLHGRELCSSRRPRCGQCTLKAWCPTARSR